MLPDAPFLISIPAWGEWHATACIQAALRSVRAAVQCYFNHGAPPPVRFLIHSDRSDFLRPAFRGLDVEFRPVPADASMYVAMGNCHREALKAARPGEIIVLMCADQVISGESLVACQRILSGGKRAVYCVGPRMIGNPAEVPVGVSSRALLAHAMANLHPWSHELVFGSGRAYSPSLVYFRGHGSTVVHGFHLHPFAVLNDRALSFKRATLDLDLIDCFAREEIHVVTDPDELSTVEISPPDKMVALGQRAFTASDIAGWARNNASSLHEWLFEHRIVLSGSGEGCGDDEVVAEVWRQMAAQDANSPRKKEAA